MNKTVVSKSSEETQKFAKDFAVSMQGGEVILLFGNLGAGKTTFMQGFAEGLGVENRIISPTFIIMREYAMNDDQNYASREQSKSRSLEDNSRLTSFARTIKTLYHLDLYRTTSEKDLDGLGIEEVMQEKNSVVAIEWPEKLGSLMPQKRIEIRFETLSETERKIEITYVN